MKRAVILGASGLVGSYLLEDLLQSNEISQVLAIGRSPLSIDHPKLLQKQGDLTDPDFWSFEESADLVFVCIGTTKSKTPDQKQYFKIDHDIPVFAGKWAQAQSAEALLVISSLGADPESSNFYLQTKGKMEADLLKSFTNTIVLRPSLIMGDRKEKRAFEAFGQWLFKALSFLIPKKYQGVSAKDIARAMFNLSQASKAPKIVESKEIPSWAEA